MSTDTFGTGNSMELCQAANQTREAVDAAAMADRILCYVQTIVANDTTGQLSTIYDGSYHIFGLSISGGDAGTPDHIKMKIIKTGSVVTGFEMFACGSGSQKEYLSQTISGNAVNMVA
jgi:hypothetical protein